MDRKISLALESAEKNYKDFKNLETNLSKQPDHITALNVLFESFIHYGFAVSQVADVLKALDEDSLVFEVLIEPHLHVVNDLDMISRQYTKMFVQYIAQISVGTDSKLAVEGLFA